MKKLTKDLTWDDFNEYIHLRINDGNWSAEMAEHFIGCYKLAPKSIFKRKKRKWFNKYKKYIFNTTKDILLDIESGYFEVLNEIKLNELSAKEIDQLVMLKYGNKEVTQDEKLNRGN